VWLLPAVAGALVIRRPGAALFVEMVAALLEYLLGNPWGPGVLISGLLQGLGVEVAFALFRWRGWRLPHAVIAGALAAVFEIVLYEWWSYAAEYAWGWKLAVLAFSVISGVLVAGVGAHYLVRALARAGALRAFPPGAELAAAPEDPAYDAFPAGPLTAIPRHPPADQPQPAVTGGALGATRTHRVLAARAEPSPCRRRGGARPG
jgi:ABC-type thiamin/hydroxymethylpyrimidine transport system permease subunit